MDDTRYPPVQYLNECLDYDPETGVFMWRTRPQDHFMTPKAAEYWNRRWAGTRAMMTVLGRGYLAGRVAFEGRYPKLYAHRVAWALMTGSHPKDQIDHIDLDKTNNRWANLREADNAQNSWNKRHKARELPTGVSAKSGKFRAGLWHRGDYIHIGTFLTPEEASVARTKAAAALRLEFARVE
ncbi:putative HNH endonuclease protein [Rhizobium phage RHph_N65]|nr:putative HNH endonuclease protein [Rhizobium phage RHph_N65]